MAGYRRLRDRVHRRAFLSGMVAGGRGMGMGLVLAACTTSPPTHVPATQKVGAPTLKVGGSFREAVTTDPDTFDPHVTSDPASSAVFANIYSTLLFQDFDKTYKPLIVDRMDVGQDNKTLTFTLRQNVKFTNGDPLDATAVKFTFDRLKQIGTKSPLFETANNFAAIDVVDPRTVRITLNSPQATIFHDLATEYAGILSPKAVNQAGERYARQPVGSGPYSLEDWKTGQEVTLVRNAGFAWPEPYYENSGAPYIERHRFRVIPEPATTQQLFDIGELDVLILSTANVGKYDQNPKVKTYKLPVSGISYVGFNCRKAPFDDRTVRQALSHAIDKDEIVRVALGGELGQVINTPLPPSVWGYDENLGQYNYRYDPEAAKLLLAQLGYRPGPDGVVGRQNLGRA